MPNNRFYLPQPFQVGQTARIAEEELRHLRVLRPRTGELIELINGQGQLATTELTQLSKNEALVYVKTVKQQPYAPPEIILAQALPRINRLDTILEKSTELGATQFWLFPGEHGEREKISAQQEQRMHHVVTAALKQCGRLWKPQILLKPPLADWTTLPEKTYFGDVNPSAPLFAKAWRPAEKEIAFMIGPEAGFSPKELDCLHKLQATGVSLHSNILRTDTAPIVALSVIYQLLLGV